MDPVVLALVLLAAVLHASWNALVKVAGDPFVRLAVLNVVSGLCALPLLFVVAAPAAASWPYLLGSVAIHLVYNVTLAYGYRHGDLSHVYPIARGIAPPLVALGAWLTAGENPGPLGVLAILVISGAIASLAFTRGWRLGPLVPVWFALATGLSIAGYTICDGLGGRAAGDVLGYIAWLFVLDALPFGLIVGFWRRHDLADQLRAELARLGAGRRARARRLWPRDLGDDPGADGERLGAARDLGDHGGADRRAAAARAVRGAARGGGERGRARRRAARGGPGGLRAWAGRSRTGCCCSPWSRCGAARS